MAKNDPRDRSTESDEQPAPTYHRPAGHGVLRVSEDFVPFAEFRANASRLIREVREDDRHKVITQHGRPAAVLVPAQWYDRVTYEEYVRKAIAEGLADLEAGRTVSNEQVMAGLEAIIEKHRKRHEARARENPS